MQKISPLFLLFLCSIIFPLRATNTIVFADEFTAIWNTANTSTGSSAANEISIPTNSVYTYNYTVDWGDGNTDTNITGDITHTYATEGLYTVLISGNFPAIYFNNSGDKEKIIEILDWGTIQWQSMENAFSGCTNINFDAISAPDLSQATSLKNMFKNTRSFNGIVNNWNISTITDISGIFYGARIFNRPLDNWNTSNVEDMSDAFRSASLFNEPLDNWNTSLVTSLSGMFRSANKFNQNINNWDVSQVTNMADLFYSARAFNMPLNLWNVGKVKDMSHAMSNSGYNLPLNNWNVSQVTNMSNMFESSYFNQPIDSWDVSSVEDMSFMFQRANRFNQPLNNWNVGKVTDMESMFDGYYWANKFDFRLDQWDVSEVTNMRNMFRDTRYFNQDISAWDVSNVIYMGGMFERTKLFNQDISAWDISKVKSLGSMFAYSEVFNQPLDNWDLSSVESIGSMFYRALAFNQPVNSWNTSKVKYMSGVFSTYVSAAVFNQPVNNWDTSAVESMSSMFAGATVFDQDLSAWNISKVENMSGMLDNAGLSKLHYDNALMSWAAQTVKSNVKLGATNLKYCDSRFARQDLIDNHNWTITNDIVDCPFVFCTSLTSPINGDTQVPANANLIWEAVSGATGYRVSVRIENGGTSTIVEDNTDVGNVVGLDFTTDLSPGDEVFVTIVPYNATGPATGCVEESFAVIASWVNDPTTFKLTYDTRISGSGSDANQIEIEHNYDFAYNYAIDWGDDQYNNNVTGGITHTYLTPGIYTITIKGDYPAHYFKSFSDSHKLLSIDQWGTQQWKTMESAFSRCSNMTYNTTDIPDLSQASSMKQMFYGASKFNGNVDNWDVSTISDMTSLFSSAEAFNQPLNSWNVSSVTSMKYMFGGATVFNQALDNWNTNELTDTSQMFYKASAFNQSLNDWNVSKVTDMSYMFYTASAFNQPLDNWDVSKVTDMSYMFFGSYPANMAFNQSLNNWDVSEVKNMSYMFYRCTVFNQPLNNWDVSAVETMSAMFYNATAFNQPLNNWTVTAVTNMNQMFYATEAFDQNINSWNVTNVLYMQSMFEDAKAFNQNIALWNVTNVVNMKSMFENSEAFNQNLNNWDVNSVVTMNAMFSYTDTFNQPLNNWDVSAVADMTSMFEEAASFNQPIANWDVSSVTLMPSMFEAASAFNSSINSWDVASVTNMDAMFKDAILYNQALGNWNTEVLQTTAEMFSGASVFNQNINSWNTGFVTTMKAMFKNAIAYNQPMNSWNVASVTTLEEMFNGATVFNQNIDAWNVRGVLTTEAMFYNATSFNQPLNNWRVANSTNMDYMFRNAVAFNQPLDQWDLGSLSMRYFLSGATTFNQELSAWDVSGVTDMRYMLDHTALNRENYDTTLIAWSDQELSNGIALGAQGLPYCDALEERQAIIDSYSWTISGDVLDCPIPVCTQLIAPLYGAVDVPVNTNLSWEPALYARGYRLTVVTQPGNITVVNNETITNETVYTFASDFVGGEMVEVTIVPFNDNGDASSCTTEGFTITTISTATAPECTSLSFPLDGAINIAVTSDIIWQPIANADGYRITVGTNAGANNIVANADLGNVTTYEFITDLPENTTIYTSIIPYNSTGDAITCTEESFTTELIPVAPICTNLNTPVPGAIDVPIDTDISWDAVPDATGYLLSVGTTGGGIEVLNNIDVGNVTTYDLPTDLSTNRLIFVRITPYNAIGDAIACTEESFRTGAATSTIPACATITSPITGAIDVLVTTDLSWTAIGSATGYKLGVGTTSGGTDILTLTDVGIVTSYDLAADLPQSTIIYITLIPYNSIGDATGCTETSFTTETLPTVPSCTSLSSPLNGTANVVITTDLDWNTASTATGYKISVGTSTGATDILNLIDVGNVISYDLTADLPESTSIFVTLIPYNAIGDAIGCSEASFTTETLATIPSCTSLSSPLNGTANVVITTDLDWNTASTATGYKISVGTSTGVTDILNLIDIGNATTYDLATDLPESTEIFVTLIPYNAVGDAIGCSEASFTTETLATIPNCTTLSSPLSATTNVAITTDLDWNTASTATGYKISVGTSTGATDILNLIDIGNATTYDLATDLPESTEIFVTIIPYNAVGDAMGCTETSFTTETLPTIPSCTSLSSPLNGTANVVITTDLDWNTASTATGYKIAVGTSTGATDILNLIDIGNATTYDLATDLPESTEIFVTIIPYNAVGDAIGCSEATFTTETLATIPNCTTLSSPLNGTTNVKLTTDLDWNIASTATGYKIAVGSTTGATDILNLIDIGNATTYDLATDLPESTEIFVTIIPYNAVGDAIGCSEASFTTETLATVPNCTQIIQPLDNTIDVVVDTYFSWETVENANGYILSIGTSPGGTDVLDNEDVGFLTQYSLANNLKNGTTYYFGVIAYNAFGNAKDCSQSTFTTMVLPKNDVKHGFSPNGDGINDYWHIAGIEDHSNNTVTIYNRWGDSVFQIQGYNNSSKLFTGVANQKTKMGANVLPSGTYFYRFTLAEPHNFKSLQGFVVIKR